MRTRPRAYSPTALAILAGAVLLIAATAFMLGAFGIDIHFTR